MIEQFDRSLIASDSFRVVFLGGSNSGKTTYLFSLFNSTFKKTFDYVYCFSTKINYHQQYCNYIWYDKYFVLDKIESSADKKNLVAAQLQNISNFGEKLKISKQTNGKSQSRILIIFDDCGTVLGSKEEIKEFPSKCRHYGISIIALIQSATQVPPAWRDNLSHLFLFGDISPTDLVSLKNTYKIDPRSCCIIKNHRTLNSSVFKVPGQPVIISPLFVNVYRDKADLDVIHKRYSIDFLMNSRSEMRNKLLRWIKSQDPETKKNLTREHILEALKSFFL